MEFDELINELSNKYNLDLKKNEQEEEGYYVTIDDSWVVQFFQAKGNLYLMGMIGELPDAEEKKNELLKKLLQQNLGLIKDNRVVLCLEPDNEVLYAYTLNPMKQITLEELEEDFSNRVNFVEYFSQFVESFNPEQTPDITPVSPHFIMP